MGVQKAVPTLLLLLLLVAGAAASVSQVNGTCPANAPSVCGKTDCCNGKQSCLANPKGTGKSCLPKWYVPVIVCLVAPGTIIIVTLFVNWQGRLAAEEKAREAAAAAAALPDAAEAPPAAYQGAPEGEGHKGHHHKAHTAVSVPQP